MLPEIEPHLSLKHLYGLVGPAEHCQGHGAGRIDPDLAATVAADLDLRVGQQLLEQGDGLGLYARSR